MEVKLEILEKDANKKGDLFGRLMKDFFHSLGYKEPKININRTGREIDIKANHRIENRIAIAECKAHATTIGGSDINKFVGVFDAEKRKGDRDNTQPKFSYVGYFISLSGFKESAIEQEVDLDNDRVILVRPEKVIEELIRGKIIVSKDVAISSLRKIPANLNLMEYAHLLAHERGWIWAFYYSNSNGQNPSHVAFVHAEGRPLINAISHEIINFDALNNNIFDGLTLIEAGDDILPSSLKGTSEKYFKYLENELGDIQFEGLPTDKEAGSVKVKLENIFIPLHLIKKAKNQHANSESKRERIGDILEKNTRLAILAKPGAGKSTLIKRIAISYAFPERRIQVKDGLPNKNWFPIFLRCRELGNKVTLSITEIINNIPQRAEISSDTFNFSALVSDALQNGLALLLIDGLDEIADDKHRVVFINQLRTFIATYPNINIIVTSREVGFRVVAGSLDTYCENYTVSNLESAEIRELCLKWHKSIIDESENTQKEAMKLSELILKDSRIRVLAENPLLLTTLMFVKRWAGYLPTKRSVLYQEMIKLLLVTWNVEGHEILDIEEAEPQLAFVAYWMTSKGVQTINADELNKCLINARRQMPEILGYTNISPSEFIKRVESRSSLLILTGHKPLGSGNLVAVYEFLHLSFQEYLTAKAIVKKFIPQLDVNKSVVDLIKPNLSKENWKEVIPLVAVLLEREAKSVVEYLIQMTKIDIGTPKHPHRMASHLLGTCLANEVQVTPNIVEDAIEWYVKSSDVSQFFTIINNKYGPAFKDKVFKYFFSAYNDEFAFEFATAISDILESEIDQDWPEFIEEDLLEYLLNEDKVKQCLGILGLMNYGYYISRFPDQRHVDIQLEIFSILKDKLEVSDKHFDFLIGWALAWNCDAMTIPLNVRNEFAIPLVKKWIIAEEKHMTIILQWALEKILTPDMPTDELKQLEGLRGKIKVVTKDKNKTDYAHLTGFYLGLLIGEKFPATQLSIAFSQKVSNIKDADFVDAEPKSTAEEFAERFNIKIKVELNEDDVPF